MKIYREVYGVQIPFPLERSNACEIEEYQCPILKGSVHTYQSLIPLTSYLFMVSLGINIEYIHDEEKQPA